jgi:hypothetical protein
MTVVSPDSQPWKLDTTQDAYWGLDETEELARMAAEKKAAAKQERMAPVKPRTMPVSQLPLEEIEWQQPEEVNASLHDKIEAAHKNPQGITYTVISHGTDLSKPEERARLFGNLHKQLQREVKGAKDSGSWWSLMQDEMRNAEEWSKREDWSGVDGHDMWEPSVREIVRTLIKKRRELAFACNDYTSGSSVHGHAAGL